MSNINAIDINFPGSNQLVCSKHLKDGTVNYMQSNVGVPQKGHNKICDAIFGDKGAINTDDSIDFETKSRKVIEEAYVYPKLVNYFKNKLQPPIKNVNAPTRKFNVATNWTNSNCESLNHIMKLDANWKVKNTPDLINMLHEMTMLHFKDFRRALYGEGNYRLYGKYAKYSVSRSQWKSLNSVD